MISTNVTRLSNISIFVGKGSIGSLFIFFLDISLLMKSAQRNLFSTLLKFENIKKS